MLATTLLTLALAGSAAGQAPTAVDRGAPDWRARLDELMQPPADGNRISGLRDQASAALRERSADPDAYWALLTSPDTAFIERAAAAYLAALPYESLPRLMTTLGELRAERRAHSFGLRPNPSNAYIPEEEEWWRGLEPRIASWTEEQRSRTVLGHAWRAPSTVQGWVPMPDDLAESSAAPWPLQVELALEIVLRESRPRMTVNCDADVVANNVRWLDAALRLPCTTDDEAFLFVEAACMATHHVDERVLARYRTLILDDRFPRSAERILSAIGEYPRLAHCADPKTVVQIQVLLIDALEGTLPERIRDRAGYAIPKVREQWNGRPKRPEPATLILLASERGTRAEPAAGWHAVYVYLFSACEAMDAPPFAPDRRAGPSSAPTWVAAYRPWFDANREDLERAAAAEKPALEAARARLIELEAR